MKDNQSQKDKELMEIEKEILEKLDYYKVRDNIAAFCVSEEGKKFLNNMEPFSASEKIECLKNISREWKNYINANAPHLQSWQEVFPIIKILKVENATLALEEIRALQIFCTSLENIRKNIKKFSEENDIHHLNNLVDECPMTENVLREINFILNPKGDLRELAELKRIKEKIAELTKSLQNILYKYTQDSSLAQFLESSVPVLRNGRQVLALRSFAKNKIAGIIHGVSQSGQTVYIEPSDCVNASNELTQEKYNLELAIRTILFELTKKIAPYSNDLENAFEKMLVLDATRAASLWGIEQNGCYALTCDKEHPLTLVSARHPILGKNAVPLDLEFLNDKKVLIITGPNTGGKTVCIKTIALFSLLNQSGFPIPASDGTYLPIFTSVYADIGDGQSLDESLSTFSAHMKRNAYAIEKSSEKSLVLLDELGSGTDPQEGSALAMSILDSLIEKKSFVLVTTHHGALKNYGWTQPSCINASVEFNAQTLSPTYRLVMGVPGESRAFDIAQNSGVPLNVVQRARKYIEGSETDISFLINSLNEKHSEVDSLLQSSKQREHEFLEKLKEVEVLQLENKKRELELKTKALTEVDSFLSESRKQLENLVRILREGEITKEKTKAVRSFIDSTTAELKNQEANLEKEKDNFIKKYGDFILENQGTHAKSKKQKKKHLKNSLALELVQSSITKKNDEEEKSGVTPLVFKIGAIVIAGKNKRQGTIVSANGKNKWLVQFDSLQITMEQKDLELVRETKQKVDVNMDLFTKENPSFELRLLGKREAEAIEMLERQLYLCSIHNFKEFSVIHGKGYGVLQEAVHSFLSKNKAVKNFRFANPEDGGTGKTYVELF